MNREILVKLIFDLYVLISYVLISYKNKYLHYI